MKTPSFIRNGQMLILNIDSASSSPITSTQVIKNQIHETIEKDNIITKTGVGDQRFKLVLLARRDVVDQVKIGQNEAIRDEKATLSEIENFLKEQKSFVFFSNEFGKKIVNLVGNYEITVEGDDLNAERTFYSDATDTTLIKSAIRRITLELTTALDPILDAPDIETTLRLTGENTSASALDRLKKLGKKIQGFTSEINEAVEKYTNEISEFSSAIANVFTGIGGTATIVTNPIKSVLDSLETINGGLSSLLTGLGSAIQAIKLLPSELDNAFDQLLSFGSGLKEIFSTGNSENDNKIFIFCSMAIADVILENKPILDANPEFDIKYDPLVDMQKDQFLQVMLVGSILINLYNSVNQINRWNKTDLEFFLEKTQKYYKYLIDNSSLSEFSNILSNLRSKFIEVYKLLQEKSLKIYEYEVNGWESLYHIVYKVNGNYDYFEETKAYNNIIGSVTNKNVKVIRND